MMNVRSVAAPRVAGMRRAFGLALTALSACAVESGEAGNRAGESNPSTADLRWEVSEAPSLSIGVVEGDETYQLSSVRYVRRLPDGRIVLLDGGATNLRIYDSSGEHLKSAGSRGDGPGEFRIPQFIEVLEGGGLGVVEAGRERRSRFTDDGDFLSADAYEPPDGFAPLDQWFHGKSFVQADVEPGYRTHVNAVVDRLPPISDDAPIRWVVMTEAADVWVTEAAPAGVEPTSWRIYDLDGVPTGTVKTPARFLPHQIGDGWMAGVYWDDLDVEYAQVYTYERPSSTGSLSAWLETMRPVEYRAPALPRSTPEIEEVASEMRSLMRNMQSSQEIYYSDNFHYASDLESMGIEPPESLDLHLLGVGSTGWMMIADHAEYGVRCMVVTGRPQRAPVPRGFLGQGRVLCS